MPCKPYLLFILQDVGASRACYFGTSGGGFGEVSGAYRLVLFIQLEVAHKHFRLARPTESAQGGGVEPSMLTNLAVQLLLFKTRTFAELELELEHEHELELALELELEHELELAANRACYIGGGLIKIPK